MIIISTDVFCDICGEWFHGGTSHKMEVRKARREARAVGWFRCRSPISGKMSDICPPCMERIMQGCPRRTHSETHQ